ncbi:MAG: hypothetical protein JWO36_3791 [Myxococcales bacterium]|nr:hypothetical protein [Myxococcales bacterium]
MSVSQTVFLARSKLPTREAWLQAIRAHGFELTFDASFDPATDDGHLPCVYRGAEAGFEYFTGDANAYLLEQELGELREQLGGRDFAVSFVTRSRMEDLKAASIAGAVLVVIADGLLWSDEAGEFIDAPLQHAHDLEPVFLETAPAAPQVTSAAVDLAARIVFRGQALTTLETLEAVPRRFTAKVAAGAGEVRILALWQQAVGKPTIHRLRIGAATHELDPKGNLQAARPIATLISLLGVTESATRELLLAGAAAVSSLCEVAGDSRKPMQVRRMAIVMLGQIGDAAAKPALMTLSTHTDLGSVAADALKKLQS